MIVCTEPSPPLGIGTDFMILSSASKAVAVPIIFDLSASTKILRETIALDDKITFGKKCYTKANRNPTS